MGDVHGDIEAFAACLQMAGLVDDNGDWAGGTTVLVQVYTYRPIMVKVAASKQCLHECK
jgi:hypothetical protein